MPHALPALQLANQHLQMGQLIQAADLCQQVLQYDPWNAEAYRLLALIAVADQQPQLAPAYLQQAILLQPDNAEYHDNLAAAWLVLGRFEEAEQSARQAAALSPDVAEVHHNLARALESQGRLDDAIASYRQALALKPALFEAANNLGGIWFRQGRFTPALEIWRQALAQHPQRLEMYNNLGMLFKDMDDLPAAEDMFRQVLALHPGQIEARIGLAFVHQAQGRADAFAGLEGDPAARQHPLVAEARSGALLLMQYDPAITPRQLLQAHRAWDEQFGLPVSAARPHANVPDPNRPLRFGFLSPDFGEHPVGFFLVRLLEALRGHDCEVIACSTRVRHDALTRRLKAACGHWHDWGALTDDQLADAIRGAGIDLLFDMSGHTRGNRLPVLARRPAPIQLTWCGYVGTTGLAAIDYLIADRFHVPSGEEGHYREEVLRLPDGYVCYDPPDFAPAVGPLPALTRGGVTFGSMNNPAKLNPAVVALWAEVLRRTPGARLLLQNQGLDDPLLARRILQWFADAGIDRGRLDLHGWSSQRDLFARCNQIDLALDTFPYSGGLTTCEALWMGVPVVTWPGQTFAGRHSLSHLANVGLTETIAASADEYVAIAVRLAHDLERLAVLRGELRPRMAASPLCDGPRFARHFMAAMREVWRRWCAEMIRS